MLVHRSAEWQSMGDDSRRGMEPGLARDGAGPNPNLKLDGDRLEVTSPRPADNSCEDRRRSS
jgi:hypothetical protein